MPSNNLTLITLLGKFELVEHRAKVLWRMADVKAMITQLVKLCALHGQCFLFHRDPAHSHSLT